MREDLTGKIFHRLNGETKALSQWCRDLNLVYDRVLQRKIKLGWSDEDALLTP